MWPNLQSPADLVTFTEEVLNGKLHFLCSALDILVSNVIFQFSPICSVHWFDFIISGAASPNNSSYLVGLIWKPSKVLAIVKF